MKKEEKVIHAAFALATCRELSLPTDEARVDWLELCSRIDGL